MWSGEKSGWICTAVWRPSATQADADDLLDEIVDRYGEPPKGVLNLVDVALLRAVAQKAGICDIRQKAGEVNFALTQLDFQQVSRICASPQYKNRLFFVAGAKKPHVAPAPGSRGRQPPSGSQLCRAIYSHG